MLLCFCFGPIKITLSNYLKPICFVFNYFYVPRRGFFIVCVVQIRAKVCVLPLLLACFVALWLPYKYFSFSYVFKKQMSTNFRSIFAIVRLNEYYFPLVFLFVIWVISKRVCVTCLLLSWIVLTRIIMVPFPFLLWGLFFFLCVYVVWVWILCP